MERQRALRERLAGALEARHRTTGVPLTFPAEALATGIIALVTGLAQERIADPDGVPDDLLGELLSLLYDGLVHRAEQMSASKRVCVVGAGCRASRRCAPWCAPATT